MFRTNLFALISFASFASLPAMAAVPDVVTYAGRLNQGTQPANGTFSAVFELFDAATAGNRVFQQAEPSLPVTGGELVVDLGNDATNPLTDDLLASSTLFLEITVNGETLTPRVPFTSVPFARRAKLAEHALESDALQGLGPDDIANLVTAGAGLTSTNHVFALVDGGVATAKLADNAVTTPKIQDAAVTSNKLAPNSVNTNAIIDGQVNTADLAPLAVTQAKIGPGAVGNAQLASQAVSTAKIANFAVDTAQLNDAAVTSSKILNGAVGNAQLASNAVSASKIQAGAIHKAQVTGLDIVIEPTGCGRHLVVASASGGPSSCESVSCDIHRNQYSTNNEDVAPSYFDCGATQCGFTNPSSCTISQTSVGVLVKP